MSFHDRLRAARKDANLSVNGFAKKMGVSSTAAWNWDWENTTPTPDKLPKIAEVLGVTVDSLTGGSKTLPTAAPSAEIPVPEKTADTLDAIMSDASARVATLLGIEPKRVKLDLNLR